MSHTTVKTVGTVKWYNDHKGFGFIQTESQANIFVHYSAVKNEDGGFKSLIEGQSVKFDLVSEPKGAQAFGVTVLGASTEVAS